MGAGEIDSSGSIPEVLSLTSTSHMVAYNHLQRDLMPSSDVKVYMQVEHSYRKMNKSLKQRKLNVHSVYSIASLEEFL